MTSSTSTLVGKVTVAALLAALPVFLTASVQAQDRSDEEEGVIETIDEDVSPSKEFSRAADSHPALATSVIDSPEVDSGVFVPEPEAIDHIRAIYDVTAAQAERILRFQQGPMLRVADALAERFGSEIVTTELDAERLTLIVYVSGEPEPVQEMADREMGSEGVVEVRGGLLAVEVIQELWERMETALHTAGVPATGALGPNRITVYTSDVAAAEAIVDEVVIPSEVEVVVEFEEPGSEWDHITPRGGWAGRASYTTSGWCTLGFSARRNGVSGFVTAGHRSESSGTRVLATTPAYVSSSTCLTTRRMVQYYQDSSNPKVDFQFERDEPGYAGSCMGTFSDDVCASATHVTTGGGFYQCTGYVDISGWSWTNPMYGTVRVFGSKHAGVTSGTIINNLFDPCGPCSPNYVRVSLVRPGGPGDSGGPVRIGSTLQGIVTGGTGDGQIMWYTKVGHITEYGVQPATANLPANSN